MYRRITSLFLLSILLISLSSCYDSRELDDTAYVLAVGIDKGISDKWRLTLQFPNIKASGGGSSGQSGGKDEEGDYSFVTVDAPSFFTGMDMLNTSISREFNFMHAQLIVFSEEIAKSGLIDEYIAPINRFREIRGTAHLFVCKGSAMDFIKENKPLIGSTISKNVLLMVDESERTGFFPHVTLQNFYEGLKTNHYQPITCLAAVNDFKSFKKEGKPWGTEYRAGGDYVAGELPRTGKNKIEFFGTALFDGEYMVGELNGNETRYLMMMRGDFKNGLFTLQDPKKPSVIIPLDVRSYRQPDIKVKFDGQTPIINVKVFLNADLLAVQSRINYEQPELKKLVEESFKKMVLEGMNQVIKKCQDLNVDSMKFGNHSTKSFLTIEEFEKYNWNKHFKDAKVTTEVDFIIRRTGTQIKSQPTQNSTGESK